MTGVTNNGTSLTDLGYYASNSHGLALKTYYGTGKGLGATPEIFANLA